MSHSCWALTACGLFAVISAGCGSSGPKLFPTTGTVTFEDKPVEGATVLFVPQSGAPSLATTDAAGKFTIATRGQPGAPAGTYKVSITKQSGGAKPPAAETTSAGGTAEPSEEEKKMMMQRTASAQQDMVKQMQSSEKPTNVLPFRYSNPDSSNLSAVVTEDAGKNVFDFALKP